MIIQVTGTGTANKGAELLLIAIKQQITKALPQSQLAVTSNFGSFDDRAHYGLRTVLPEFPKGRWWLAGKMMPHAFRQSHGLVSESEVDAVLDASGFAFGDQLGAARVQRFAHDVKRWKKQGKPIVLLPQALGPFENSEVRAAFKDVANDVDLIYARDNTSFQFVSQLGISPAKLRRAPDFTNLVNCPAANDNQSQSYQALLVPNHQMIARTSAEQGRQYIPFLAQCYRHLKSSGLHPAVMLHDERIDRQLIEPLRQELKEDFVVLTESNPVQLKAALGCAKLVVGSRFHALVGALSQAVPTIAVGWSHKYVMLLTDYDCPDAILTVDANNEQIANLVGQMMNEWDTRHQRAMRAADNQRQQAREMWDNVLDTICRRAHSS